VPETSNRRAHTCPLSVFHIFSNRGFCDIFKNFDGILMKMKNGFPVGDSPRLYLHEKDQVSNDESHPFVFADKCRVRGRCGAALLFTGEEGKGAV
jgi:hypothetical protein